MLKIGEFSRLSQVTVKSLHHYDEIGLLKPAHIDKFTGYRYYTLEQLPRLHRVMVLKELGLSLEQINQIIYTDLNVEHLRGMLTLKEAEVQQQVHEEQARLARIRFHLRQIDMEANMSQLDVLVKQVQPFRALTSRYQFGTHAEIEPAAMEIMAAITENDVKLVAPLVYFIYANEYSPQDIDVEFVCPVEDTYTGDLPLKSAGVMPVREIPGIKEAATYIYTGAPDDINNALVDLQRWIAANGYRLGGVIRLVHLRGPLEGLPRSEWLIEAQHPLERA